MAFSSNINQEVRLQFSSFAEEVILNDMFVFQENKDDKRIKRSTFINNVIRNYYQDAEASISLRLEEYEDRLINTLEEKASKPILSLLRKAEQERLEALASSYDKPGKHCPNNPIRLQNDLFAYLTEEDTGTKENLYNNYTLPGYLRTIIEEYARLPYKKRERIYYREKYETIETAILAQKQLLLTVSSGRQFHVLPSSILGDPLGTTSYLVGFAYDKDADKTTKIPCSFRISTLKDLRVAHSKSGYLSPKDKLILENKIAQNGVQFLISENIVVKVRLSKWGINNFNHQLNLRPTPIDIDGNIYTFHCSMEQARFYFFKFGKHAEILSPEDLRETFKENYWNAYQNYT